MQSGRVGGIVNERDISATCTSSAASPRPARRRPGLIVARAAPRYTDGMAPADADPHKADPPATGDPEGVLSGWLHTYVAFDWGEEIDLGHAGQLGPSVALDLSRRPRTPSSIAFKPPPLHFTLQPIV